MHCCSHLFRSAGGLLILFAIFVCQWRINNRTPLLSSINQEEQRLVAGYSLDDDDEIPTPANVRPHRTSSGPLPVLLPSGVKVAGGRYYDEIPTVTVPTLTQFGAFSSRTPASSSRKPANVRHRTNGTPASKLKLNFKRPTRPRTTQNWKQFSDFKNGTGGSRHRSPTPKELEKQNKEAAAAVTLYQQRLQQYQQQHQQDDAFEGFQRRRPAPSQPDCIVAFHVPKTGGSSFKSFLGQVSSTVGWTMQEWYTYYDRYGETAPATIGMGMIREKVIHTGHFTPAFFNETATQNCLTVTMLREPVDRVISCFYYHKHVTSEWKSCLRQDDTPCRWARQYQNDVTRLLSVNATWTPYNYKTYSAEKIDREHLERAQQFLMDTDLVCFLDQFEDCKRKLLAMANLTLQVPAESVGPKDKTNVGKTRKNITVATRNQIELVNSLDIELYEWAVQQFRRGNRRKKR